MTLDPVDLTKGVAFPYLIGSGGSDLSCSSFRVLLPDEIHSSIALLIAADERQRRKVSMIELTRLNGSRLSINCDLIKHAESAPDTVLTLITGEKLVVLEPRSEVTRRTLDFRASVLRAAWPEAASALGAKSARDVHEVIAAGAGDGAA
jgi:flagellar protein FlbD